MTIDSTVHRIDPHSIEILAGGGIAAVILFSVGVFLMVVPILGWVVGPALMLLAGVVAIAHVGEVFRSKPEYAGHCPNCGAEVVVGDTGSVGTCAACSARFEHRDGRLVKLA